MKLYRILVSVMLLMLSGCGVIQDYRQSQMFSTFDDFRPGPDGGSDLIWAKPGIKSIQDLNEILKQYDSVMIDQVWLVLDDKTRYDNLSEQQIVEVSEYLIEKIREKASTHFKLVDMPKEKTLRISVALTNIETPNPILAVTSSLLPIGLGISTIAKVVTGEHTNVGSATIEMMISDASSGDPIVAVIDRKAGSKDLSTMIDSTDDARDAVDWWVDRIALTLRGQLAE
ncbi:DUF3313 domain-containing protein [Shewanella sp. D64]|uniref:DUF3313 domain-containing protein n=1 Tax=unclassified Shewanella TaxID=196818 RepID=UPI0022BA2890|nr:MULTISPECIES: DUF3313 domain-containing protein [unclassified Shewanella]MEC4724614.1 DUF3313 domain-containing protein [Shewanella sp. D64]MEC4736609.1 DUF3313 domain-containing protein [Shewanella sp. E94]WBJ94718.1 DUF3313 domain-containing protein [Shewanella sp. MTB7]